MKNKILIFDASSLISLAMNGLEELLPKLKRQFGGKFIIPKAVKKEVIDKPKKIKKYSLGALKLEKLLQNKVLELPSAINIEEEKVEGKKKEVMKKANTAYRAKDDNVEVIHKGEAECIALSLIAKEEKIENAIAIDERSSRMIVEKPDNLRKLFESKLHTKVNMKNKVNWKIKFIRSAELVYIAYKNNLIELENHVLDALLHAVKSKGCAISTQEIKEIEKMNKKDE